MLGHPSLACLTIIDALRTHCPSLEDLTILSCGDEPIVDLNPPISLLVCSLQHLRHLNIGYFKLTPQAFLHLASLPHLRTLRMAISGEILAYIDWPTMQDPVFSALDHIAIQVMSMQNAVDFVHLLKPGLLLQAIGVSVIDTPPTDPLLRQLFLKLIDRCIPSILTEVGIFQCNSGLEIDGDMDYYLNRLTIEPLFRFPNLEVVKISTSLSMAEVDDTLLKDIAGAWPRLRIFHIAFSPYPNTGMSKGHTKWSCFPGKLSRFGGSQFSVRLRSFRPCIQRAPTKQLTLHHSRHIVPYRPP